MAIHRRMRSSRWHPMNPSSIAPRAPQPHPPQGWTPLKPFVLAGPGRPFLESGDDRLRVLYYRREADQGLVGLAWFGPGAQGPPGCAHGGSIMSVLDEAMGAACWQAGHRVMAARLTTNFRAPVP